MENREYMSPTIASVGPTTQALAVLSAIAIVSGTVIAVLSVATVTMIFTVLY